ncbi:unnamed protein product [Prorocentrum cordatum]|uniref:Uncharacterized protein n=1 Tax=Prorocentrum cordatum TaxID=2364126 RepID=A0ABN9QRI5_9DINO|nr:unnamed protein product [Polarella glacialis]
MAFGLDGVLGEPGVLTGALLGVELHSWCALQGASRVLHAAVGSAQGILRSAVCTRSRHRSLWDLCADGDITGLWATAPDESLAGLRDPNRKTTLLHVALERKLRAPYARLVRWLMSRPGGDDMARCKDIRGETPLHISHLRPVGSRVGRRAPRAHPRTPPPWPSTPGTTTRPPRWCRQCGRNGRTS